MTSKSFQSQTVLITGAASGIGRATALHLASLGASLILTDINEQSLTQTGALCAQKGAFVFTEAFDLSSPSAITSFLSSSISALGPKASIDHVFANAGINPTHQPIAATTAAYFDQIIDVNLKAAFLVAQACLPHMPNSSTHTITPEGAETLLPLRSSPSITFVASIAGITPSPNTSVYSASKAALMALTKSLARELGPRDVPIRVNAVAPGFVDTPTNMSVVGGEAEVREAVGKVPLGRMGRPEEIASVVGFLMGEGARYMSGSVVEVNGGL